FGGSASGSTYQDTWTYNGVNWTQLNPTNMPPPSVYHNMAYDTSSNRVIMNGGASGDTWAWDGANWSRISTTGPSWRITSAFVQDPTHPGLLIFGGSDAAQTTFLEDTWILQGSTWTELSSGTPRRLQDYSSAYDSVRQRVVVFGGDTPTSTALNDT